MSRVQPITIKKSPVVFFAILFLTMTIVFIAKLALGYYTTPVVHAVVVQSMPEEVKTSCRLPQHEVFSEAEFGPVGVTPAEAQGVDSRWETARLIRSESEEFVRGAGSAGGC